MDSNGIPEIGDAAPDFTVSDESGMVRRLAEMISQGPLFLVFYRGHW